MKHEEKTEKEKVVAGTEGSAAPSSAMALQIKAKNRQKYGEYLFGSSFEDPNAPASDGKPNWNSHTIGRTAIRLFSRGIMGATFYAVGVGMIRKQFNPELLPINQLGSFVQYPLRYIARAMEHTAGSAIRSYVRLISPAERAEELAHKATWFRDTAHFGYVDSAGKAMTGRGLGHEAVAMTFDFAMGSIGDAWGRRIVDMVDPNIENSWYKDGKFDVRQFGHDVRNAAWTILTKNQGEDWAASLPYIYQMRWQRQAINKLYPGFTHTSDRSLNGAAWLVNDQGNILKSFSAAGALDLQFRFTGYNWYTLMFRDGYDALANTLHKWYHDQNPPTITLPLHPIEAAIEGVAHSVRYVLKSGIKAGIYMTPAVPFFWSFRTPQSGYRGLAFQHDPASGEATYVSMPNGRPYSYLEGTLKPTQAGQTAVAASELTLAGAAIPHGDFGAHFNPYAQQTMRGPFDRAFRWAGVASDAYSRALDQGAAKLTKPFGFQFSKTAMYDLGNASISYTPYMIMKAETALRWNHEEMDNAIYKLIDGTFGLNLGKVKAGLHDIREEIMIPFRKDKPAQASAPKTLLIPVPQQVPALPVSSLPETPTTTLAAGHDNRSLAERFATDRQPPQGASIH